MSATDETNAREPLSRPPLTVAEAGERFRASPPVILPRRRSTPLRRPARLLPPASSRRSLSPSATSPSWTDRVWIPAVLASAIMMGAIGVSVHTDLTAKLEASSEPIALVDTRIETSATPPQPSKVAQANTRLDQANPSDLASTIHPIAVAPMTAAPSDVGSFSVAPPPPLDPPSVVERAAGSAKTAAATILAPPSVIDQPYTPLVIDNLAHAAAPTSNPRVPITPPTTNTPHTSVENAVATPPRTASAAMATSSAKPTPKGRLGKQRASAKSATVAKSDIDPDAPPRTWDGIARLQLIRSAP